MTLSLPQKLSPAQRKFFKIIQEKGYFQPQDKVLIALSGGLDSMTLFNWLYHFKDQLGIELGLAHVNHGLRQESDHEEAELRKLSQRRQVDIYVDKFTGKFTEQAARTFRYEFFEQIMREHGYTILLTAHHKGDQAETVMMRAITGRPLRSLQGIAACQPFANGRLIRPLLDFDKAEFDAADYFEDVTNFGTDYLRNRIRNSYLPTLAQENPQIENALLDLSHEIQLALQALRQQISDLALIQKGKVNLNQFQAQGPALQHFILQEYLTGFPDLLMNKAQFDQVLQILNRPQQYQGKLNKNTFLIKNHENFYIQKSPDFLTDLSKRNLQILQENPQDPSFLEVHLPLQGQIEIRSRRPGDMILIHGHHKKLRKYFIEEHIPLEKRQNPLLFVEGELYAIAEIGCSDLSKRLKNGKIKRTIWVKLGHVESKGLSEDLPAPEKPTSREEN